MWEICIVVIFVVVIGVFVVVWLLFFVMLFVMIYCKMCKIDYVIMVFFIKWMYYSGFMVNLIIYIYCNCDFCYVFVKILILCGMK